MDTSSIPGLELIQVADVVAREKSIEREEVMLAMEEAIQKAGRAKYGLDRDIRAMIDRKTGAIRLERWIEVVEEVEDELTQMSVEEGKKQKPPLGAGEFWRQSLPPIEFGRIAAQRHSHYCGGGHRKHAWLLSRLILTRRSSHDVMAKVAFEHED